MILDYVIKFHLQDCLNILSEKDIHGYFNVKIDFLKLFEAYPDVGDKVLCNPVDSLPACDRDIIKAQRIILENDAYTPFITKLDFSHLKRNVHARFFGLPVCPELHRLVFPKNVDLGCFLKVTGTVVRMTQAKMLEYQRKYICVKCKYENLVEAEFENRYVLKAPSKCGNKESRCKSSTFTQVNMVSREYCKDYQEIKIQELVNKLSIGSIPGSMWVVLEEDLVDCCKPGDDVNMCGTVRRRWRPTACNKKSEVDLVLQANYIEVCNAQRSQVIATAPDIKDCFNEFWSKFKACPLKGRDRILDCVCPEVYGLHLVKLALLLTVITGSNHVTDNEVKKDSQDDYSTRVRGQCHLLLVGDPGTGKSQLLQAGVSLTPRSVFTSGAGSTRAGLTCSALREDGEWQLEAGALVLSDGGVCCIDEISQLRDHDRTAIHEAMEQQTISVAKAGIVCKLNTRCAVIAACNPKGHYQTDMPLSANVSLGTPLLSRFDLIFILLDTKNRAWDKLVSSYILFGGCNSSESKKRWSIEKLQMYIGLVGPRSTEMTKSANIILQTYYMTQRKSEYRDPSRTTVRMLDSLIRLSQAHCRLMYRTAILPMDAIVAASLVDLSMQDCTLNDTVDALHSTFHKYPDLQYLQMAEKLLTRLNLFEIWREELLYYAQLLQVDHKTLESEIKKENCQLFAKYDDVTDDNITLSATLITSSYFNNNQSTKNKDCDNLAYMNQQENNADGKSKNQIQVNSFTATLKKHTSLNKIENKPCLGKNTSNKQKRKVVNLDTFDIKGISKRNKTKKPRAKNSDQENNVDENDKRSMLNAIPSVNDIFNDLGIDFTFTNNENHDAKETETRANKIPESCNESKLSVAESCSKENNTISKLKQFQFKEKHDYSKYEDKHSTTINKSFEDKVVDLENNSKIENKSNTLKTINQKSSISSSQLSIFESSDCDIDLDI